MAASRVTSAGDMFNSAEGRTFITTAAWEGSACKYKVVWFCLFSEKRSLGTLIFPVFTAPEIPLLSLDEEPLPVWVK